MLNNSRQVARAVLSIISIFICFTINGFSNDNELNDENQSIITFSEHITDKKLKKLVRTAPWAVKQVANGIVWKYHQFPDIFDSRQSITIFDIDLNKPMKIDMPYAIEGVFLKTSDAGMESNADVALNGSYFNTKVGGSTTYFKSKGSIVANGVDGFNVYRENAAFVIDALGRPSIEKKPFNGWREIHAPSVLASGPLLIYNGEELEQQKATFNTNRHPRTVVGLTKSRHLLMVVIDGRSSDSKGMTIPELSQLMMALGCNYAMNMDGGGSSTAWVKGEGVVNYPCDNRKFDHEGERPVSTILTVTAK